METNITVDVKIDDLWEAIWASEGSGVAYWAVAIRTLDRKGISLWKQDERGYLVRGYGIALKNQDTHCGNYLVADLDDPDECTGDTLLQYAVFGELIYG